MNYLLQRAWPLALFVLLCTEQVRAQEPALALQQDAIIQEQRTLIAAFSGAAPGIDGERGPSARSTRKERALAADFLLRELQRRGLPADLHRYQRSNTPFLLDLFMPPVRGQNVVSHIPATVTTDEYVIVGAHYDSVAGSPGADDNATGVAAALIVASAVAKLDRRDMHFLIVFFDQEEESSPGSQAFAQKVIEDRLNVHSMHNIDMLGWDGDGDYAVDMEIPTPGLSLLYESAANARGIEISKTRYNSSDHIAFRDVGIHAVCLSERFSVGDSTPHYHKPTDAIDAVNFEFLASGTLLMVDVMTTLASGQ